MAKEWRVEREGDDEHKSDERWLVTYADMITVLMIFFIVMYALSAKISAQNFERLAKSLNNSLSKKQKAAKVSDPFAPDVEKKDTVADIDKVTQALAPFKGRSQVKVDLESHNVIISLADTSFFDLGSTTVKPDGVAALMKIAQVIATASNEISVEGHTDSVRAANGGEVSNWVIAATRAANVAHVLSEKGNIPAKRFVVTSYGEFRPLFNNDTPEHKAMNRRVDIVIHSSAPKPAMTPKPGPTAETLPPAFGGTDSGGLPTAPPNFQGNQGNGMGNGGGNAVPNPFGNAF